MRLEERVVIARDTENLWAFFMDIQNLPRWDHSVARVQATSDNDGVGVGFTFDTFAAGDRGRMSYEVTRLRAPYEYEVVTRSGFFRLARWQFTLQATAGGTVVTCVSDISLPARHLWLRPVLAVIGPKAIRTDLAELKRVTEAVPGDATEAAPAAG
jgi:Polyketide cyclase / dehydrase and lipid transport